MPLSLQQIQAIQSDAMADDLDIDLEKMSLWTEEEATAYFESGGQQEPLRMKPPPELSPVPKEELKKWFPRTLDAQLNPVYQQPPTFRMVCFHAAGCAESMWSGNGLRQPNPNPFVAHCKAAGGEMLACELPGRELRRSEARSQTYAPYVEQLYPVLAPLLVDGTPYVMCAHSMGTWFMYELMKKLAATGVPLPKQCIISGFPPPDIPMKDRTWNKNRGMNDEEFKAELRGWNVNEVALVPNNFKMYSPMFRDDFTLFDEYTFSPLPDGIKDGFPVPFQVYYMIDDKRVKKEHVEGWKRFTSSTCDVYEAPGHHLAFFDIPARAEYMKSAVSRLPAF